MIGLVFAAVAVGAYANNQDRNPFVWTILTPFAAIGLAIAGVPGLAASLVAIVLVIALMHGLERLGIFI